MNATTLALLITIAVVFLVIGYCVKRCKKPEEDAVVNPQLEEPVPEEHKIEIPVSLDLPITPVTVSSDTLVKSENAMKPETVVKEEAAKEEVVKTDEPKPAKAKAKKASKPKAVKEPKASVKKATKKAAKDEAAAEVKVAKPRGRKKKTDDALVIHVSTPVVKPGRKPRKKA